MVNAISLYLVILIPMDSAAILLSRTDMIARPDLELIRLRTMKRVIKVRITPIAKVEFFGVPVIPCAPFNMIVPFFHLKSHSIFHGKMKSV